MMGFSQKHLIAFVFFLFSLTLGFVTIERYGVMNDASIKYASGFRNYYFLTTGDIAYLDPKNTPRFAEAQGLLDDHKFLESSSFSPVDYSPLFDVLSVLTCNIFHQNLAWLNYFDAHNATVVILFAAFCALFYFFSFTICGFVGSVAATFLLALFPRLLAHSHNNLSDIPLVFFFFATIAVSYYAVHREKPFGILLGAFLCGLTVATKLNGAFLIFILIPWYVVHKFLNRSPLIREEKIAWSMSPFVFYIGWVLPFPYFWTVGSFEDFFNRQINSHIFTMLGHENIIGYQGGWNLSVFSQAFATTPTLCLILFIPGVFVSLRRALKNHDATFVLLFLWLLVPILKSSLPGIKNYEMIRHFMEYIPAFILFCGIGVGWIMESFSKMRGLEPHYSKIKITGVFCIIVLTIVPIARLHPYEILYFNNLSGGLAGAKKKFIYAYDYWQNSLRQGIEWVNANGTKGAKLTTVSYFDYNVMEPAILRKDLVKLSPLRGRRQKVKLSLQGIGNVATEMMRYQLSGYVLQLIKPQDKSDLKIFLSSLSLKPEFEIIVDGEKVAQIFYFEEEVGIIRQPDFFFILKFNGDGTLGKTTRVLIDDLPLHY